MKRRARDLAVRETLGDERQHLALALRSSRPGRAPAGGRAAAAIAGRRRVSPLARRRRSAATSVAGSATRSFEQVAAAPRTRPRAAAARTPARRAARARATPTPGWARGSAAPRRSPRRCASAASDVDDRAVRLVRGRHACMERVDVAGLADDVDRGRLEHAHDSLPGQHHVVRHDHSHGASLTAGSRGSNSRVPGVAPMSRRGAARSVEASSERRRHAGGRGGHRCAE